MKPQLRLSTGQIIKSPNTLKTRPTTSLVREALINIIGTELINKSWLDLFSGSGIISCEALIKGASKVVAIESDRKTYLVCKENLILTSSKESHVAEVRSINSDVIKWLKSGHSNQKKKLKESIPNDGFDFVYIDPPYKENIYTKVLENLLSGNWIRSKSLVICESSNKADLALSSEWLVKDKKTYGRTMLTFLNPIQV